MGPRAQATTLADENAGPVTRARKTLGVIEKSQTLKAAAQKTSTQRTALGDLSNKTYAANGKAAKPAKASTRAIATRRRSASNPVVEKAKAVAASETLLEAVSKRPPPSTRTSARKPSVSKVVSVTKKPTKPYWDDLDECDVEDPLMVAEYVVEIFEYMRELETSTLPASEYMSAQTSINWRSRAIVIDWIVEIHSKFHLLPETLFLSVNLFDRFLAAKAVDKYKLQLVGLTTLFIAAKYEEIVHPSIQAFAQLDKGSSDTDILKSEIYILQTLEFGLHFPNPMNFLRRISKAEGYELHSRTLAKYLMEVTLLEKWFVGIKPSLIAAGAAYFARKILGRPQWNNNLMFYSGGYSEDEVVEVANKIQHFVSIPMEGRPEAVYKKYTSKKFMKASTFTLEWVQKTAEMSQTAESVSSEIKDGEVTSESDGF